MEGVRGGFAWHITGTDTELDILQGLSQGVDIVQNGPEVDRWDPALSSVTGEMVKGGNAALIL